MSGKKRKMEGASASTKAIYLVAFCVAFAVACASMRTPNEMALLRSASLHIAIDLRTNTMAGQACACSSKLSRVGTGDWWRRFEGVRWRTSQLVFLVLSQT